MRYYHVWFQTKKKKRILIEEIDKRVCGLFTEIAMEKGYELLAANTAIDHAHLLFKLSKSQDISIAVKMFKGVSARRIFKEFPMLKYQIFSNNFWARKFDFREVPVSELHVVKRYIKNQKKNIVIIPEP